MPHISRRNPDFRPVAMTLLANKLRNGKERAREGHQSGRISNQATALREIGLSPAASTKTLDEGAHHRVRVEGQVG